MVSEGSPLPGGFGPGSRISGYLLEEQIGRGGMAVVFRALDERLDRRVALKILAPALAEDEAFRQRFIRESRAAASVDDPHIIPVFEAGEASGVLFIAMRLVRGGDVRSLVSQSGRLPPGRSAEIISQIASALDAAHARGLVHRDVKLANMLVDSSSGGSRPDHVYLSDFGLSKGALASSGLTGTGQFLGTLDYISPEQIEGKPVDGRADEYALACAAFELLCGAPPFQRDEATAVMYAHLSEPPPLLTSRRSDLPPAVDEVFVRALAKARGDRYPNCREFSDALRDALGLRPYDSGPGISPVSAGPQTELARPAAESAGASAAAAASAAGVVGGPQTEVAASDPRYTTPGLTVHGYGAAGPGPGGGPRAPRWRSPRIGVPVLILLLVLGGGGAYLAFGGKSGHGGGKRAVVLALPGCGTTSAAAKALHVPGLSASVTGNPFGLDVTSNGHWVFAVTPTAVAVLHKGPGLALTPKWTYTVGGPAQGVAMTADGRYLLVASGNGITVLSVSQAEQGASSANAGTLTAPNVTGDAGAVEVALSPDDRYAFVTLQHKAEMAVFNLRKALTSGFSSSAFVGDVPLGTQPVGVTASPDGQWLYVTSMAASGTSGPGQGTVSVVDLAKAETSPATAVVSKALAGCSPVRVITSADGRTIWVTARDSNYLLGFSAVKLRTNPAHALIAKVQVGQTPVGEILVNGGKTIVIADTDTGNAAAAHNLAVVNVADALAHKPALRGYVPSGLLPREFALVPGGQTLLVSDNGSAQVQSFNVADLP